MGIVQVGAHLNTFLNHFKVRLLLSFKILVLLANISFEFSYIYTFVYKISSRFDCNVANFLPNLENKMYKNIGLNE